MMLTASVLRVSIYFFFHIFPLRLLTVQFPALRLDPLLRQRISVAIL